MAFVASEYALLLSTTAGVIGISAIVLFLAKKIPY